MILFNIDNSSAVPAYQQVKQAVLLDIMAGRLNEGDRIPSIRELAKILKLNPNTVAKAYYNLEDEGYILGRRGSGYVVKSQRTKIDNIKRGMLEDQLKNFLENAFSLGFTKRDIYELMRTLMDDENE